MPIMRIKEIAALSAEDRIQKLIDLRAELTRLRTLVRAGGAVENPTRIRLLRKTIAQILTVENEQKIGLRKVPESKKQDNSPKKIKTKKVGSEKVSK